MFYLFLLILRKRSPTSASSVLFPKTLLEPLISTLSSFCAQAVYASREPNYYFGRVGTTIYRDTTIVHVRDSK